MKPSYVLILLAVTGNGLAQTAEKLRETAPVFSGPESVAYDPAPLIGVMQRGIP